MMPSKTEQLMKEIRRQPIFRQLIPMEAAVGWPIPVRRDGAVYVTLPFYGYSRTKEKGRTMLYPPLATITLAWSNQKPVEYVNLRFRNPQPALKWDAQVGVFPHSAVAGLTVGQYLEKRGELLAMYDEMLETLAGGGGFSDEWTARFGALLRRLMEPSLEPYYRALAPGFFDRFLAGKRAA